MQTATNSSPRVDIIPPTETKNSTENDIEEPIAHHTRARRATPWPWAMPLPATLIQLGHEPVVKRARYKTEPKGIAQQVGISPQQASHQRSPRAFIRKWAMPVMDTVTGETLEHRQLRCHHKYKKTWNQLYSNELGRLCQGIGKGSKGPKKNASRELTLSGSSDTKISPSTTATKVHTPRLCANTGPTKKILTERGSPLEETGFVTPEMLACQLVC